MERTMQTTRRYKRTRQPRRIVLLWLVCLFAAVSFGVLLAISPAAKALLRSEGGPAPAVAPVEGREIPGVIDAPFIDQRDKYPTGCESVTAVMALQYAGVDITVEEFIDNYLPQGSAPYTREDGTLVGADPWKVFLGSPYEESGWGCYAPVITEALEQLLQDRGLEGLSVQELEGESLDKLCREYIDAGTPVLLWATIAMEAPVESTQFFLEDSGQLFTWLYPLHCLLLTGEDKDCYYFNDPLVGKNVAYPKEEVETAYEGIGMQAVVLEGSVQ